MGQGDGSCCDIYQMKTCARIHMHGESKRRRELGGFCHRKGFFESDPRALFCFSEAGSRTLTQGASLVRASEVNKKKKKKVGLLLQHNATSSGSGGEVCTGSAERPVEGGN